MAFTDLASPTSRLTPSPRIPAGDGKPVVINYITSSKDGLHIGARNQALGVAEALERTYGLTGRKVIAREYDINSLTELAETLSKNASGGMQVVLGVGDDGARAFAQLPVSADHLSVLIGHEIPKGLEAVKDHIDLLAIPEHVTDLFGTEGIPLLRTHGVAHAITPEKAEAATAEWRDKLSLPADKPVVIAMLGGAVDGKDYTAEEARNFGKFVVAQAAQRGAAVIATNSPRATPEAIKAFSEATQTNAQGSAFFPFMSGENDIPFKALLGLVKENGKSLIVATGDSISMPSEAASVAGPSQLTIYSMSNQNKANREFVKWMQENGHAAIVMPDGTQQAPAVTAETSDMDASRQIAAAIQARLAPQLRAGRHI